MALRTNGASAGFGWLKRGISVGFRHFRALSGGTALLMLAYLVPMIFQLVSQHYLLQGGPPSGAVLIAAFMAVPMVISLLLLPLKAGYLQIIDAAERGLRPQARDIFKPYRQGRALAIIGYGLTLLVVYVGVTGLIIALTGGGLFRWYMGLLTAQAGHLRPTMALPDGSGIAISLIALTGIFMLGLYSISLGQVALRRRRVFGAIGDGFNGALKNYQPLVVLVISMILGWTALLLAILVPLLIMSLLGALVGLWLVLVVLVPIYIALFYLMISGLFGVEYHLWRDVCGGDTLPSTEPSFPA